ncbi:MAG TPA: nitrophenyl compound nitroreductase subunit ArsF family protein [Flavisolibacter sp.]|jgi:hypothetical protein|nr:nitrophenyl compound nitroreductase subunit ArsF family protein [Flavisolibacter sp.]
MKKVGILLLFISLFHLSFKSFAQNKQVETPSLQVIQFHLEHRCISCLKIEKFTKASLTKYFPSVPFELVNVEEKKNAKKAEDFHASGTALFLYNPKTGKKKDLTASAFMNVGDEAKFEAELKKAIEEFIKS